MHIGQVDLAPRIYSLLESATMLLPNISNYRSKIPILKNRPSSLPAYKFSIWCPVDAKPAVPRSPIGTGLNHEARSRLRAELETHFKDVRSSLHGMLTKSAWTSLPHLMFRLDTPTVSPSAIGYWNIRDFCNKPAALYWTTTAQANGQCPMLPYGCIYKEWYRYYDNRPNIDFAHFFANPVQVTSTGPQTIAGILEVHQQLCDQVSSLLDVYRKGHQTWPCSVPEPQHFELIPIYRAVIIILDNYALDSMEEEPEDFVLDEEIRRQNALIIATGDNSGLSAPVTFESIQAESLPIEPKNVVLLENTQIIRVSLLTAVHFIIDLEKREEAAFPSPYVATERCICPATDNISFGTITAADWADEIFQKIDEKGIDNVKEAISAQRQLEYKDQGISRTVEFPHFSLRWKY